MSSEAGVDSRACLAGQIAPGLGLDTDRHEPAINALETVAMDDAGRVEDQHRTLALIAVGGGHIPAARGQHEMGVVVAMLCHLFGRRGGGQMRDAGVGQPVLHRDGAIEPARAEGGSGAGH